MGKSQELLLLSSGRFVLSRASSLRPFIWAFALAISQEIWRVDEFWQFLWLEHTARLIWALSSSWSTYYIRHLTAYTGQYLRTEQLDNVITPHNELHCSSHQAGNILNASCGRGYLKLVGFHRWRGITRRKTHLLSPAYWTTWQYFAIAPNVHWCNRRALDSLNEFDGWRLH